MTALTLSEDELYRFARLCAQESNDGTGRYRPIQDDDIERVITILTRCQAPDVCECGGARCGWTQTSFTYRTCNGCGKRIKEET